MRKPAAEDDHELLARGGRFADFFRALLPESVRLGRGWREAWAKVYRDLRVLDGREDREIAAVCQWARGHDFWRRNFFSPEKLRQRNGAGVHYFDVFAEGVRADAGEASPMPRHELEACEAAHRAFCEASGRGEPFRLHARAWRALLASPEFAGLGAHPEECDAAGLGRAVEAVRLVVRYLARGIARGERQPGALKLANVLPPARFFAELEEARKFSRGLGAKAPAAARPAAAALPGRVATDEERARIAAGLAGFLEEMKGAKQ